MVFFDVVVDVSTCKNYMWECPSTWFNLEPVLRYSIIKERLERLGYSVCGGLYNTADFGLPQQRRRAWILCHLRDQIQCTADTIISDVNFFQRLNVPLSKCLDNFGGHASETKSGLSKFKKVVPGEPKWQIGFEKQCEIYGKARALQKTPIRL